MFEHAITIARWQAVEDEVFKRVVQFCALSHGARLHCLQVLLQLKQVQEITELRVLAGKLHRGCAALRASLEQHVRAEEQELWPLFAENFSTAEQERLIGIIIGRTGAEVLQSLLPWVTGAALDVPCARNFARRRLLACCTISRLAKQISFSWLMTLYAS